MPTPHRFKGKRPLLSEWVSPASPLGGIQLLLLKVDSGEYKNLWDKQNNIRFFSILTRLYLWIYIYIHTHAYVVFYVDESSLHLCVYIYTYIYIYTIILYTYASWFTHPDVCSSNLTLSPKDAGVLVVATWFFEVWRHWGKFASQINSKCLPLKPLVPLVGGRYHIIP